MGREWVLPGHTSTSASGRSARARSAASAPPASDCPRRRRGGGGVADPVVAARILVAAADGLILRVLVGDLTARQAEEALRGAVDGTIGL